MGKVAAAADHLANDDPDKFLNQISLGPKNENKKDRKSKELKVTTPSEEPNFRIDGNGTQKSSLQKLIEKFSRK